MWRNSDSAQIDTIKKRSKLINTNQDVAYVFALAIKLPRYGTCSIIRCIKRDSYHMFSDIILLTRELFFISPELTKERCEKQETYQQAPVTASDIQFLDHYDEDKVHLNAKNTVRDSVPGMKKYQCRLYRRSKNLTPSISL